MSEISIFWFRRDLRFDDNTGLIKALSDKNPVMPIFIFDTNILENLTENDARVSFIYENLKKLNSRLNEFSSSINIFCGKPIEIWKLLIYRFKIKKVFLNTDYEPYAISRDNETEKFLNENGINVYSFKDQVIFEKNEILKNDGTPYTVFTPYKNKFRIKFENEKFIPNKYSNFNNFHKEIFHFPELSEIGFKQSEIRVKDFNLSFLKNYSELRNFPDQDATSYLSPHLRFGTISIREIIRQTEKDDPIFFDELVWREFFKQILFHFPYVIKTCFRAKYNEINWRNNENEFAAWCEGRTGYTIVDAGMSELNRTGYMHNRVRMITASFLCKHLLIDYRWGEAYFAEKLLDFDLSSNNGNWQWTAGTGCDAAPYFRIFNPLEQQKKFDKDFKYIKKFLPEFGTSKYPKPIVEHKFARERCLETYKKGILM